MSACSIENMSETESDSSSSYSATVGCAFGDEEVEESEPAPLTESPDSEDDDIIQPYADEPMADQEWIDEYRKRKEKERLLEEKLKERLVDKTREGEWCTCGHCRKDLIRNISECYCCQELEGCIESMSSELVLESLPEGTKLKCITEHPGFQPVVLDRWSLRMSVSKFKRKDKTRYKQTGSEDRLLRSVAYREFTRLVYGFLGKKRIPLPACAYTAIRTKYPLQENEQPTGFMLED